MEAVSFDPRRVLDHVLNTLTQKAEQKDITVNAEFDPRISPVLVGDSVRLSQVLTNLISNAIKFTNEGGRVDIECVLVNKTADHNTVVFRVIDTGIGIPEDKLDTIFESFTQADASISRKYGGTGLGLTISKKLVEMFGGQLKVKSSKATGTTFFFQVTFPVGEAKDLERKTELKQKNVSLEGLRVLLAEDHDINQFLATTLLDEWGTIFEVAENGLEVTEKMKQNEYDIILMDIQMPVMGGIDATKWIRKKLRSDIPIIALTANALKGVGEKYLSFGMNDYVSKPFEPVELFNKIAELVERHRHTPLPLASKETKPDRPPSPKVKKLSKPHPALYNLEKLRRW
ncbi:MAG: response regulator [Microscillaceae bacterium]|nr:response regulator [Microscillaceae bacterium]